MWRRAGARSGGGLYYSLKNWGYPAYFEGPERDPAGFDEMVQQAHNQVGELMSNYGPIDILWYDGAGNSNFAGGWGEPRRGLPLGRS